MTSFAWMISTDGRLYKAMVRGNGAQKAVDLPRDSFVTMRSDPRPQTIAPKETRLERPYREGLDEHDRKLTPNYLRRWP
jgi:hypothetical protein